MREMKFENTILNSKCSFFVLLQLLAACCSWSVRRVYLFIFCFFMLLFARFFRDSCTRRAQLTAAKNRYVRNHRTHTHTHIQSAVVEEIFPFLFVAFFYFQFQITKICEKSGHKTIINICVVHVCSSHTKIRKTFNVCQQYDGTLNRIEWFGLALRAYKCI